jgi:hypothetical protein
LESRAYGHSLAAEKRRIGRRAAPPGEEGKASSSFLKKRTKNFYL